MNLSDLRPALGSTKNRKRIGRGHGSGTGKTSGKGHKGQKARAGGGVKAGFEGGQMPLQRRLPKRGFTSLNKKVYALVNLGQLDIFAAGSVVDAQAFMQAGLIKQVGDGIKVLGDGELSVALTIQAHKFSKSALEKIAGAGGKAEVI
ncbi:50S ribosomal protein L15 [Geoalkalibacter sp.]|uniref:50S ribosomal protein L15 n=1 Tax=Geoalkalibacter sp. TaxID=3041440 RepID=UPI00272DFE4A|nr:50S ribosomal protein L15 [Geoalkalibacter sp.]